MERSKYDDQAGVQSGLYDDLSRSERQLLESIDEMWDNYVDSRDATYDELGVRWTTLGQAAYTTVGSSMPMLSEAELGEIRGQCRALAMLNEFAINGHENRISYIVGRGHQYRVSRKSIKSLQQISLGDASDSTDDVEDQNLPRLVQSVLDEFVEINGWHKRQQEMVRRLDRDGELFLRYFDDDNGICRIRFVEPDQVYTPEKRRGDPDATLGIQCKPGDVESVHGYWIDERLVEAEHVQHRKANVDTNVKRGLPLYYPVRKNLRRAEKLLRNMSVVAEIQSAIAIIRKHQSGSQASIRRFVENQADVNVTNPTTGRVHSLRRYEPGTILDAFAGTDYQFPAAALDAGSYVAVLQAELRAIAARLVMPEFMLTSDASNANYSSTMVAEGPAVRMFERMQFDMIEDDLAVMRHVVRSAIRAGRLPEDALLRVNIEAIPPSLSVRDRYRDARADEILVRNGAMSRKTMAVRHGLNPEREQEFMASDKTGSTDHG